ncbi:MAG: hydrogenase maturation protease, partial [Candidatus Angelobacter sp.]
MSPRILVAGIGNILLGDDGFGVEVANRLATRTSSQELCIKEFGIRGLDLAYAMMDDWELVIMVDAVSRGGKPGSLCVIEPDITDIAPRATLDAHAMTPERVLQLITVL